MIFYRKIQPFQAITFDLDDTLYDNNVHMPLAEAAFMAELHQRFPESQNVTPKQWRCFRESAIKEHPQLKNDMGELRKQILTQVFQTLGFSGAKLRNAVEQSFRRFYFHRSNFTVEETIHSLLKLLSERYPLVAITNGNVDLDQIGLASYFCHIFKANLQHAMKPHRAMFDACQRSLDIDPRKILHVGDNLHNDVLGAIKAGFQSAWYAHDRSMLIKREQLFLLPDVQLNKLTELFEFDVLNTK